MRKVLNFFKETKTLMPSCIAQLEMCLTADPDPIHTFMEIDHVIISTAIFLSYPDSFKKGCCQLQVKVCA